jgi:hypothetical protein
VQGVIDVNAAGRVYGADDGTLAQVQALGDFLLRDLPALGGQARTHLLVLLVLLVLILILIINNILL